MQEIGSRSWTNF